MRKGILALTLLVAGLGAAASAQARDTPYFLPIQEALATPAAQEKLDPNIRLVFADAGGNVSQDFGEVVTSRKTNAFNKTDEEACRWVMLSALIALQDSARQQGGNAVVNIESFYDRNARASTSEYECHAGALMAGVALKGDVVTLR
ncbi:excinuclease ATPase subunit [Halomonas litopenaei]|uniref:Excinuclease ATPase subunit n=1 Tax=Halomonas litopenaei TaxID=2109328 RepID=A0ABX5IT68_9GAMM|nr:MULTISPECIES: excinuclease ATPase subunit [Halomonas]MBR9772171.1 excinuclease ATPase subunit [Gammaproteobacteria bacterium]MBS8270484.1 excinuclease ATPase subunit [Halomonas litopenaei]MBY5942504.1 excinuclease ATPase subunit [Halomonas sp. DP5N14-9]PTL89689.1 excinuclease ATPase subunit [Halomonas sp. SYSU XM8]PTL91988.1 excinuclease ATPase subunit [Halomonas litopenaei]